MLKKYLPLILFCLFFSSNAYAEIAGTPIVVSPLARLWSSFVGIVPGLVLLLLGVVVFRALGISNRTTCILVILLLVGYILTPILYNYAFTPAIYLPAPHS